MEVSTEVAREMVPAQVVEEGQVIEEEFFAEVAVGVWQDFSVLVVTSVSKFDVFS